MITYLKKPGRFLKKVIAKIYKSNQQSNIKERNEFVEQSKKKINGNNSQISLTIFGKYNTVNDYSCLYNVIYGDYTYSSIHVTIMNCTIGKFCSIAQGVSIGLGKHPINHFVSTHPAFYSVNKQCGISFADKQYFDEMGHVEIGNDVWIGANSIILDDVTIGNGAVVAANSVVTENVPAYAIVGGTPAKILSYRFPEEDIHFLENFKWWDKDEEWLKMNFKDMHDLNVLKSKAL